MASGKIAYLAHGQRGKKIKNKGLCQCKVLKSDKFNYFTTTKEP